MPTARESLLSAARSALAEQPWSGVRMVDVAATAGLSRQTLYNEFGSKDGLARALVRQEADAYLRAVDRLLTAPEPADRLPLTTRSLPAEHSVAAGDRTSLAEARLVAVAEWTVRQTRVNRLLRALLTGCWSDRLPEPRPVRESAPLAGNQDQRRADAALITPTEMVGSVRDRLVGALVAERSHHLTGEHSADLAHRCELVVRLTLSQVIAPADSTGGGAVGSLVRGALRGRTDGGGATTAPCAGGHGVSGSIRTVEGR
ncbi:TetR/AcrR family transcriptional regulator [Streptomyces albipurpureus]|uniref:TetR/AcrR family transcriptional regulator n=1 Tax=Streptomyces albipurpureus TaxID=2897419 RepID=A0ABT0UKE9_9ACTN|nr:TetR/AcrR family transcriptional regulator [Streptomyces sp. CWNU-1]MCM2388075.1 TetR/AcrR family transcriptional regulator [Streptomyces sp. CWNU-1]